MGASRLDSKIAVITGAGGGIGAACVRRFVAEGATVLLSDATAGPAEQLATELGGSCAFRRHDVTSEADWGRVRDWALDLHGRVDVLLNNAGIFHAAALTDTTLEDFRRVIEVNQVGVFLGMRTLAPVMAEQGSGSIVNVSSLAGLMGTPYLTAYAASKWAVRGMTKVVAKEFARAGVRVNSVHPGQIDTDMNTRQRERTPELIDKLIRAVPLQRIGLPEEVADAVVYLASEESNYVTGSELVIDGGTSA